MLLQYFEYSLEKVVNISLLIWSLNNQCIALPNTYLVQPCQLITQMTRVNSRETKILPLKNWKFWLYFKSYLYIYLFIKLYRIPSMALQNDSTIFSHLFYSISIDHESSPLQNRRKINLKMLSNNNWFTLSKFVTKNI